MSAEADVPAGAGRAGPISTSTAPTSLDRAAGRGSEAPASGRGRPRSHLDTDGGRALDAVLPLLVDPEYGGAHLEVVQRWQQHTGAVTAKGVETALTASALLAFTEVGSDPGRPPITVGQFHRRWGSVTGGTAGSLNATTTHDTKRSEDVRARLAVLSDCPDLERSCPSMASMAPVAALVPDPHDEHFVYQTIVGAWPLDIDDRMASAAGSRTTWSRRSERPRCAPAGSIPTRTTSARSVRFVRTILAPSNPRFLADLGQLSKRSDRRPRSIHSCSRCSSAPFPEFPMCTRGPNCGRTRWWTRTIGAPSTSIGGLACSVPSTGPAMAEAHAAELLASWTDGRLKLMVMERLLRLRRDTQAVRSRLVRGPRCPRPPGEPWWPLPDTGDRTGSSWCPAFRSPWPEPVTCRWVRTCGGALRWYPRAVAP